jgi:hypothetical protein
MENPLSILYAVQSFGLSGSCADTIVTRPIYLSLNGEGH